jgi:hypothetical protein
VRYRVRDFRIICELDESRRVVLVVGVGHRKDVYKSSNQASYGTLGYFIMLQCR